MYEEEGIENQQCQSEINHEELDLKEREGEASAWQDLEKGHRKLENGPAI